MHIRSDHDWLAPASNSMICSNPLDDGKPLGISSKTSRYRSRMPWISGRCSLASPWCSVGPPLARVNTQAHSTSLFRIMASILLVDTTSVTTSNLWLVALDRSVSFLLANFFRSRAVSPSWIPPISDVGVWAGSNPSMSVFYLATTPYPSRSWYMWKVRSLWYSLLVPR